MKKAVQSAVHHNGNLLCAIDTETSGLKPGFHDLLQICIMPLTPDYKISKELTYFHVKLKPKRPENIDIHADKLNKGLFLECMKYGMDPWTAIDRFEEWFNRLPLNPRKKIIPLGANYQFDRAFIIDWIGGVLSYDNFFRSDFRDVQVAANFLNDMSDWHSERIPFPKTSLVYLTSQTRAYNPCPHDAVGDCVATADIYRRMMRYQTYADSGIIPLPNDAQLLAESFIKEFPDNDPQQVEQWFKNILNQTEGIKDGESES